MSLSTSELAADIEAVHNISAHFSSLKQRAIEFVDAFGAEDRGFFTPTEDETTRQLLVSYWNSRNALVELVTTLRAETQIREQPGRFLVAFAGALVLVDAARFLRAQFHDRPIVRRKLNEPEPGFGIAKGTYDRIQKSLTSPVHAWHLYHALQYFDAHQADFATTQSASLMPLVTRLRERMDVSLRQLATARLRVRGRSLRTRFGRDLFGRAVYGLQKAVSRLLSEVSIRPGHLPALPANVRAELTQSLRPGDVLVTRKEHAATNYFLPGFWPHAALFVGSLDQLEKAALHKHQHVSDRWDELRNLDLAESGRVVESLKDGVRMRSVSVPLSCDAITVLRPTMAEAAVLAAVGRAFFHVGKPYDFDFDFSRADRMVCTEVIYRSFEGVGDAGFELTRRAGRLTLAAEDLLRMALQSNVFQVTACFSPQHDPSLCRGSKAVEVLTKTLQH